MRLPPILEIFSPPHECSQCFAIAIFRMTDVLVKAERSRPMSRIHGRDNKETELALMRVLWMHGIKGWRRHQPLFGKPDFTFREARLAVFVADCFWHGCQKCFRRPASNRSYRDAKIARNVARDRVVRIWGHSLKSTKKVATKITLLLSAARVQCMHYRSTYGGFSWFFCGILRRNRPDADWAGTGWVAHSFRQRYR